MKVSKVTAESQSTVVYKTKASPDQKQAFKWWEAKSKADRGLQLLSTAAYLKNNQGTRAEQAAIHARLYGNRTLFNFVGANLTKMGSKGAGPADRPTFNLVESATDTLIAKISQSRPSPVFLTDGGDYKQRRLAKQLNNFIAGEFYRTQAYDKTTIMLRDALVLGTGILKIYETADHKVGIDRVLATEILVDENECIHGDPRQLYQLKLVDRDVLIGAFEGNKNTIEGAENAYADNSGANNNSTADLVMVVEGWRLPSSPGAKDGRHTIACTNGVILDEPFEKDKFPFIFLHYSPLMIGFWAKGLAEQLMGIQIEINSLLFTISRAMKLVGVPRIFVEEGSKVTAASFNNEIGSIIKYRGVKPLYEVAPVVPQELYAQLQRLIDYGYQQCGVSTMQAGSQKPSGLNSGEAIRSYNDISTDRFATISRRYDNVFIDLSHLIVDLAKEIAEREGSYSTVYPGKTGTRQIDLPKADLVDDPYVVQVFNQSSLPKDPSGRMQKIVEMIQAGMISIREGRRLLDYPDLEQVERLANASEERILQILDAIVEDGKYTPPDPFMDLDLANDLVTQYYNLYSANGLEEERCQMLRTFFSQVGTMKQAAMPTAAPGMDPGAAAPGQPGATPMAAPEAQATSPMIPNGSIG